MTNSLYLGKFFYSFPNTILKKISNFWSSKMSRLSILMLKLTVFAFKKKKSNRRTLFSLISAYSSPAWCFLQFLTSGNTGSSHSHVWQLPETNFFHLLFCNTGLPSLFSSASKRSWSNCSNSNCPSFPPGEHRRSSPSATPGDLAFPTPLLTLCS